MSTVQEIEQAIKQLPPPLLQELASWFEEFQAQVWDEQITQDAQAGKLQFLLEEAAEEKRQNKLRSFP